MIQNSRHCNICHRSREYGTPRSSHLFCVKFDDNLSFIFRRSVSHPHIVQFLGVSFNDADQLNLNAYIVLKYVDGFNLHQCVFGCKIVRVLHA